MPVYMFLRLHKSSLGHNRFRFFHSLLIHRLCRPLSMSEISSVGDSLVDLVGHILRLNFGVKSKPYGILFPKITFKTCMIQCHEVYRLSSLRMADTQSTDFRRFPPFFSCKFHRLFEPLSVICGINFIYFRQFLHGVAFFTNIGVL
ncbi:hypothetical protein X975_26276, partial [Stegodyphus mimosarum]